MVAVSGTSIYIPFKNATPYKFLWHNHEGPIPRLQWNTVVLTCDLESWVKDPVFLKTMRVIGDWKVAAKKMGLLNDSTSMPPPRSKA